MTRPSCSLVAASPSGCCRSQPVLALPPRLRQFPGLSDEPHAKRGRLRNSNRLDLRTFWSTENEFVTELRKDGITEVLKNGTATGELFSMSDTKFCSRKNHPGTLQPSQRLAGRGLSRYPAKNRRGHFQKWPGTGHDRGNESSGPESVDM